jgi:hypothetical protein
MIKDENTPDDIKNVINHGIRMKEMVQYRALDRAKIEGLD